MRGPSTTARDRRDAVHEAPLPWPGSARRTIVIAAIDRSGSTLMSDAFRATGRLGAPFEFLQPNALYRGHREFGLPAVTGRDRWRLHAKRLVRRPTRHHLSRFDGSTLEAYVNAVVHRNTTENGIFSIDLHRPNLDRMVDRHGFDLDWLPQPITWIRLDRDDLVAAAVSHAKARRIKVWHVRDMSPRTASLDYDDDAIVRSYRSACDAVSGWSRFFAANDIAPFHLTYEQLDADYEGTLARVFAHVLDDTIEVPPPSLVRTADATNTEWIAEFRRRHQSTLVDIDSLRHPT